jgi:hypothetical protein
VTSLDIAGGSGGNTFTVNNTSNFNGETILETGAGTNTVYVLGTTGALDIFDGSRDTVTVGSTTGSGGSLANILGTVGVADNSGGVASLIIDDSGNTTGQTATLANNSSILFGGPVGQLFWNGYAAQIQWGDQRVSSVTVNGGSGGNTFTVNSTRAAGPSIALNAGAGNDTVQMQGTAFPALTVSDQGGNNTLDYSGYTGDVTVDIPLGAATLISGGISGFQNVIGSIGNDLLVGDGSGNVLIGGTGRNLLIAGSSAGYLQGSAADNILIGGSTQYDTDLASLDALFAEWTRTDLGYADRVNHILNGGGLNGAAVLNASTVTGNGGGNTLLGGGELNLYYGSLANDQTDYDPSSGEVFVSV